VAGERGGDGRGEPGGGEEPLDAPGRVGVGDGIDQLGPRRGRRVVGGSWTPGGSIREACAPSCGRRAALTMTTTAPYEWPTRWAPSLPSSSSRSPTSLPSRSASWGGPARGSAGRRGGRAGRARSPRPEVVDRRTRRLRRRRRRGRGQLAAQLPTVVTSRPPVSRRHAEPAGWTAPHQVPLAGRPGGHHGRSAVADPAGGCPTDEGAAVLQHRGPGQPVASCASPLATTRTVSGSPDDTLAPTLVWTVAASPAPPGTTRRIRSGTRPVEVRVTGAGLWPMLTGQPAARRKYRTDRPAQQVRAAQGGVTR
jgi:hypothetical protein